MLLVSTKMAARYPVTAASLHEALSSSLRAALLSHQRAALSLF
jgi:hypothetical protein